MKARYLMFFSYMGTGYRSSAKLFAKNIGYPDPRSIQGVLELALLKLKSQNYPRLWLSSRTDGGVHALNSTAHVDLERQASVPYHPDYIIYKLNSHFNRNNISIKINKCIQVNDKFDARHNAISRTYLYRLAFIREGVQLPESKFSLFPYVPHEEWKRCCFLRYEGIDISKVQETAKYFEGYHDFTTFKKFDKRAQYKSNRRFLESVIVRPGKRLVTSYTEPKEDIFDYWEVEINGRGFVHNQIRRMVGAMLSVGLGKLQPQEIKNMLQIPSKYSWSSSIPTLPPDGLYLCNVQYNPEDLIYSNEASCTENTESELEESDSE